MTRVYVDEREVQLPASISDSLNGIVKHIEANVLPPKMVIRQIRLDGQPLFSQDAEEPGAILKMSAATRDRIEIFTGTLSEIARDSIQEAQSYLDRVETAIPSIVAGFRAQPGPEAFGQLKQLLEGFYWIHLLQGRIGSALKFKTEIQLGNGTTAREYLLRFASIIRQLVDAQEKGDFSLIADLLEYEIAPEVSEWRNLFAALCELTGEEQ